MIDITSNGVIEVLTFLLPGFITAWVFYGLSSFPKPSQFERLVQALIFTMFLQALLLPGVRWIALAIGKSSSIGPWTVNVAFGWTVILALLLGIGVTFAADHDFPHAPLRWLRLTKVNSYSSEWSREFARLSPKAGEDFIVLTLADKRRLMGYAILSPDAPDRGHFSLKNASWLHDGEGQTPAGGVILIPAKSVMFVEFMVKPEPKEQPNGDQAE